ncbi:glutamine cyclotransferase [Sphingomonas lenta]|uniref:Glutamine cyclotransferase n=2 Tax=Sphingomonas lenta TaxID=1141887 RepID=A0A2A2SGG0_9SPHN|nr:glutamine cyclotransferase [Sphingomonas lenta]
MRSVDLPSAGTVPLSSAISIPGVIAAVRDGLGGRSAVGTGFQAQAAAVGQASGANGADVPLFDARVVARHPHDARAFTQGLIWRDGALYESLGRPGESEVRRVRLADGRVLARAPIPPDQFGEGLASYRNELISLTWQHGIAHRWNARTLKRVGESRYPGEGWGLAAAGGELALSDGTPTLRFFDPRTFAERRRVTVTLRGRPLRDLNELEWVDGALWGNVWHTPYLVRIDAKTGAVTAIADLSAIVREVGLADPEAVANGIAWDGQERRLFVTGKLWPRLFEIKLEPRP